MDETITNGTERLIDGRLRVHYDGYWIKAYPMPSDTLVEKRALLQVLTRRLFNHIEHGLYVPGSRLEAARAAFDAETDPARKRVKGGMLAGALFNRATDILTKLVELQSLGVEIVPSNPLMKRCGEHLQEALELGKKVLHRSGEEGIDELWGEPFKAFAFPVQDFYRSRYVKVAMTMKSIDEITAEMKSTFEALRPFSGISPLIDDLAAAAKAYSETLRADADIFDIWAGLAVGAERLLGFRPEGSETVSEQRQIDAGLSLIRDACDVISSIARARVPMPKSTEALIQRFRDYQKECIGQAPARAELPPAAPRSRA